MALLRPSVIAQRAQADANRLNELQRTQSDDPVGPPDQVTLGTTYPSGIVQPNFRRTRHDPGNRLLPTNMPLIGTARGLGASLTSAEGDTETTPATAGQAVQILLNRYGNDPRSLAFLQATKGPFG